MTVYAAVLFIHIVSMLGLSAALSYEALMLRRLQRSRNIAEAFSWLEPAPAFDRLAMTSVALLLLSGIYLTAQISGWGFAWLLVASVSFFAMAPLGAMFGARIRSIHRAVSNGNVTAEREYGRLTPTSALRLSLNLRIAGLLGIILLMTARPGWVASIVIMGLSVAIGFLATASSGTSGAARKAVLP